jgi:hypothetical protein
MSSAQLTAEARAALLRDRVMKTWNPPSYGFGTEADIAQTATMQAIAWVFGRSFLGELTAIQDRAIVLGLEINSEAIGAESLP